MPNWTKNPHSQLTLSLKPPPSISFKTNFQKPFHTFPPPNSHYLWTHLFKTVMTVSFIQQIEDTGDLLHLLAAQQNGVDGMSILRPGGQQSGQQVACVQNGHRQVHFGHVFSRVRLVVFLQLAFEQFGAFRTTFFTDLSLDAVFQLNEVLCGQFRVADSLTYSPVDTNRLVHGFQIQYLCQWVMCENHIFMNY